MTFLKTVVFHLLFVATLTLDLFQGLCDEMLKQVQHDVSEGALMLVTLNLLQGLFDEMLKQVRHDAL